MNILHDDYAWSQHDIIYAYNHLGTACLAAMAVAYFVFALRLDRAPARLIAKAS